MPIIALRPDVAAKIAAGEVIERPVSVVKELIENAIDAAATAITIEIGLGGVRLIRVADNGCGIAPDEVSLAFERHATSKITTIEDLDGVTTLGFRGEALPSIAAVADVTLLTRRREDSSGTQIRFEAGAIGEQASRAAPPGTTVTVRNLFARVPARLKFLRSTASEMAVVQRFVAEISLVYPEIQFCLVADGKTAFQSTGSGRLEDAAGKVFGAQLARGMLTVGTPSGVVNGLVSGPAFGRSGRHQLVVAVNRRLVSSRMIVHAIEDAFRGFLMVDRHPLGVLHLNWPADDVDVNVHPAKSEIRFRNERVVYAEVHRCVRETLAASRAGVTLDALPREGSPRAEGTWLPSSGWQSGQLPEQQAPRFPLFDRVDTPRQEAPRPETRLPPLRVLGQAGLTYVITEGPQGLYLLDQHAAHERVLFDRLGRQLAQRSVEIQGLLEPTTLHLTAAECATATRHRSELLDMGFDVEPFGESALLVRAIPAMLRADRIEAAVREVMTALDDERTSDAWRDRAAAQLACHSAARAGQTLTMDEMRELVRQLETTDSPQTCPHGRPTLVLLSAAELERQFGRR